MYALKVVVECLKDRVKVPRTVFHAAAHTSQGAVNATGWRIAIEELSLAASRRTLESFLFFIFLSHRTFGGSAAWSELSGAGWTRQDRGRRS